VSDEVEPSLPITEATARSTNLLAAAAPEPSQRGWQAMEALRARLVPRAVDVAPRRYQLGETLGEGGLGVVYAAHDTELDRAVAVKVLRPDPGDLQARGGAARLVREARAMARLAHPNVVEVFDIGERDGGVFIVMEQLVGATLHHWLAQRRPLAEVLTTFAAAGEGLVAAHEADLVHRDFKPANVFVCADGQVKVLDFGLARRYAALSDQTAESSVAGRDFTSTASHSHLSSRAQEQSLDTGTEPTAVVPDSDADAPQAERGAPERTTALAGHRGAFNDCVTSAGVVLGTPSYMAPEQHRGAQPDARSDQYAFCVTLFKAVHGVLPFTASNPLELYRVKVGQPLTLPSSTREVPGWLAAAIRRGLEPNPDDRWPSMRALLDVLARHRGPAKSRSLRVVGVAAVAAVAAVLSIPALHGAPVEAAAGGLAPLIDQVDGAAPSGPIAARAEALRTRIREHNAAAEFDEAIVAATELVALGREVQDDAYVLTGLVERARTHITNGNYATASKDAINAAHLAESGDSDKAMHAASLALTALSAEGRYDDAEHWSRTLDSLLERSGAGGQSKVEALGAQGALLRHQGRPDAAAQTFRRALALAEGDDDVDPYSVAGIQSNLASTEMDKGDFAAARVGFKDAAAAMGALMGTEHTSTATAVMNQGIAAMWERNFDEARLCLESARATFERVAAPGTDYVAFCDTNLGRLEGVQGNNAAALIHLERAREEFETALGDSHPTLIRNAISMANAHLELEQADASLRSAQRGRRIAEGLLGLEHPLTGAAMAAVGRAELALGRPQAVATLAAALTIGETAGGDPVHIMAVRFDLAQALWANPGDRARARALVATALREASDGTSGQGLRAQIESWQAEHP